MMARLAKQLAETATRPREKLGKPRSEAKLLPRAQASTPAARLKLRLSAVTVTTQGKVVGT